MLLESNAQIAVRNTSRLFGRVEVTETSKEAAFRYLTFAGIVTCVTFDLLENRRRDWVHWAGLALYLATNGLTIAGSL